MPGSKGRGQRGSLSQGHSQISVPLSVRGGCVWSCPPPLRNLRMTPSWQKGKGLGWCRGCVLPNPLQFQLRFCPGPACTEGASSRTGGTYANLWQGFASPPGSRTRSGWAPSGSFRACPAPELGPGAACVLGAVGVPRDRFRAYGIREEWGLLRNPAPRQRVPEAPPYLRPRPARGSTSHPRL